jgi:serine/threonine protein kinase
MGLFPLTEAPQNLGKYAIIEKVGEGHLGPVYRGFDHTIETPVAIRILCDGIKWDATIEAIFAREVRAISALRHPNIAAVLDVGSEGPIHYVVMESLGNGTLASLLAQESPLSVETKLAIMIHISEGLGYAHRHGILHRDLVPGKIHLAPDGSAKLRDFALAHILLKYLPHPVVRWGAPIYLSPEQIQKKECDERSDIFSAGTIFYELITRMHPFHDQDSNKALDNILSESPIPTFEKFPDAPPGIWPILRTCLAKDPAERYASADELSEACRELLVSLAEDKQLILSELYASLSPLKKAAAQPNAAASTIVLLNEIQSLLRGEKEADYKSLDRLMTSLTQEYPSIQTAACSPVELNSVCPQLPPEEPEILAKSVGTQPVIPVPEPGPGTEEKSDLPPKFQESMEEQSLPPVEPEGSVTVAQVTDPPESAEPPSALWMPENGAEKQQAAESNLQPSSTPPGVLNGAQYIPLPPSASRYLKLRRRSYRTAAVLLSILVIAAAGYILLGSEAASSFRRAWNIALPQAGNVPGPHVPETRNYASTGASVRTGTGDAARQTGIGESQTQFSLAHDHGVFGGACRGVVSLNATEVSFVPVSGSHGFRMPLAQLRLEVDGKSLELYYISYNSPFQTFVTPDFQTAAKFKEKWDELKAALH